VYVRVVYNVNTAVARAILTGLQIKLSPPAMMAWMQAAVVPYIQQRVANRFAGEGDDVVGKWHPLKVETEAIRLKAGYGGAHPINVRTGQMKNFLTGSFGSTISAGGITELEFPNQGSVTGQLAQKIMTAQMGTAIPPTQARPVLGLNINDNMALTALLSGYLV